MSPGVHDLHGVEPVRQSPKTPRWYGEHDWDWERAEERRLNEAWEAAERDRCANLSTTETASAPIQK